MTATAPRHITGFAGVPWGASAEDVTAAHGEPAATEQVVNATELAYSVTREGHAAEAEFTVHDRHGLIVGCHVVPFPGGPAGRALFEGVRDAITRDYPDLPPHESRDVENDALEFDDALAKGEASWCVEWRDPSKSARVELLLWPSADVFWVSYYGPHADAWEEERFRAEAHRHASGPGT